MGNSSTNGPFSMAMLNNQRVNHVKSAIGSLVHCWFFPIISLLDQPSLFDARVAEQGTTL